MVGASLNSQLVKNLFAMQENPVPFLGQEDLLEKGKTTHASILAWRIPWTEKGTTEDGMAGWHHGLDGHESE